MALGPLFLEERQIKILERIEENRKVTVAELCVTFGVSSATIRNDLRDLEASGRIIRTHGGAMVKSKTGLEPNSNERGVEALPEKRRIAEAALRLVDDGDTVVLDTGTTTLELARLLGRKRDITVVTNDLAIALLLEESESVKVVFLGGVVRKGFHCTLVYGQQGSGILEGLSVDTAFMGANGFSADRGASTPDIHHAETKQLMMTIAAKVVLLFDSRKIGRTSFALFAPLDRVDAVVTDAVKEADRKKLEENGIEVIVG